MRMRVVKSMAALVALLMVGALTGCQSWQEQRRIGVMVQAVDEAIAAPADPAALQTVVRYGLDSRHYVMIRGWLALELQGVESQLAATRNPEDKARFQSRAAFLRQAIRRIDLE